MAWLLLVGAVVSEVVGTLSLRVAVDGRRAWFVAVGAGYLTAFTLLTGALALGIPLGVAYGIWAAAGVALTAVASMLLFDEPFTAVMAVGVALIVGGVLLVETGATHA